MIELICTVHLTVCYYHFTYEFQSESILDSVVGSNRAAVISTLDMAPASKKDFLDIESNYRVWTHSETRT